MRAQVFVRQCLKEADVDRQDDRSKRFSKLFYEITEAYSSNESEKHLSEYLCEALEALPVGAYKHDVVKIFTEEWSKLQGE